MLKVKSPLRISSYSLILVKSKMCIRSSICLLKLYLDISNRNFFTPFYTHKPTCNPAAFG